MDVSTLEIAIIAIVVMGAVVLIVYLMKHQMRRCRWCVRSTTPVEHDVAEAKGRRCGA